MTVKLDDRNPLTNADVLIAIEGVPGHFSTFSGVGYKITRPKWSDGLSNIKRSAGSGTVEYESVTMERAFDPLKDGVFIEWCEAAKCALDGSDITARPVRRCNGIQERGSKAWYLSGCRLEEFQSFEADTNDGSNVMMVKVVLSVEQSVWR